MHLSPNVRVNLSKGAIGVNDGTAKPFVIFFMQHWGKEKALPGQSAGPLRAYINRHPVLWGTPNGSALYKRHVVNFPAAFFYRRAGTSRGGKSSPPC
jgi:hypothetical protein